MSWKGSDGLGLWPAMLSNQVLISLKIVNGIEK